MNIYEFKKHGVILDGSSGTLKTVSGEAVDLRPQSREVLRLLATSPNWTFDKDNFTAVVWEGRQVSEDSLVQCIAEIRTAIGDRDRNIIQTVPRKGYRFVPPSGPPAGPVPRQIAILTILVLGLAILAGAALLLDTNRLKRVPVVAVLPLDDLSAAPHQGYLSDALSEGIITELARFLQFKVVARNSSFQFRSTPTDVREIEPSRVLRRLFRLSLTRRFCPAQALCSRSLPLPPAECFRWARAAGDG